MIYAIVGIALLALGGIAGKLSAKAGTVLAAVLVLSWLLALAWFSVSGDLDSMVQPLAACLVVGLLAFLIGANTTRRWPAPRDNK
ncbi:MULTISPECIES: hypothetical protein [Microbacterium]|jgi:hypothetical protein|uniref:Uncharacterized protein n=1 Tax=Microbacterium aurugineum TaxID=2851642 RepID=A0ABY4J5P3_9MICO|nr:MULTISPECIES: hypothetical protein [Microbacterium]UPL19316.1 hypothetical protein KV397_16855 [Microbacterium aurugineum]